MGLYEEVGGAGVLARLARGLHERCLADPELSHPFSHGLHADHVDRLAAYLVEVLGGPPAYSGAYGDQSAVVRLHSGNGHMDDLGRRFVACFVDAFDEAGVPAEPRLRSALRTCMEQAVGTMTAHPETPGTVPAGLPMPRWTAEGLRP